MKKRLLASLLGMSMLCLNVAAAAQSNPVNPVMQGDFSPEYIGENATVLEMKTESGMNSVLTVKTDTYEKLVLQFSETTLLMDTQSGIPSAKDSIKAGEKIFVYYGQVLTASEPPQAALEAVLTNLDEEHQPAHLLFAERASHNIDGSVTVLAEGGSVIVTLPKDVSISPLQTRNIVTLDQIRMGTRYFAWYDVVAMSMPGQATATRVVLPSQVNSEFTVIHGGDIAIAQGHIQNGVAMVPLRTVAEATGFTVTWNAQDSSIHVINEKVQTTVRIGDDLYYHASAVEGMEGMTAPTSLGAAAYIENGVTWVPAELISWLLGNNQAALYGTAFYL